MNRGGTDEPNAYRLPIAKMINGELKIVFRGVIAAGSSVRDEPKFGTGYYNLSGATQRDKERLYEQIKELYDRFGEAAPLASWEEPEEKNSDVTNFPTRGDDKEVSLANTQYRVFDAEYAKRPQRKLAANMEERRKHRRQ